jgi:hypothetical protein
MTATRRIGRRRGEANAAIASFLTETEIGPFINANPRLIPGQRFEMGLNAFVEGAVAIPLTSSDPGVVTVPNEIAFSPDYSSTMFEIVGRTVGSATITATLGDEAVTTTVRVVKDQTDIASLVGASPQGPSGQFVYELSAADEDITINMNGPVVGDRIATITSGTPEVASVPESVIIPDGSNWPISFPLKLHSIGTTWITVSCREVTLETVIEVIAPALWISSIEVQRGRVRAGDDVEMTITMTDDTVRQTAITLIKHEKLEMPTALIIPRGKRSGSCQFRVLEDLSEGEQPLQVRWLNSLYLVGIHW